MTRTYIGLDLGGTNAKYGVVTTSGKIIERGRFEVCSERGPAPIIREIIDCLKSLIDKLPADRRIQGAAIGAAGLIRERNTVLAYAPNLPGWFDVPLARILTQELELPVRLENDADLITLGEWKFGAGQGLNSLVLVTLGTGVGGGLILDGHLWHGTFGSAVELGHVVVDPEGPPCICGRKGCLESLASATAMAKEGRRLITKGRKTLYKGALEELTSAHLMELADRGDEVAMDVFKRAGQALGLVLANVFNVLGLEGAVIGGGAGPVFKHLEAEITRVLKERVITADVERIRLAQAVLGDDAGLFGAPTLFENRKGH